MINATETIKKRTRILVRRGAETFALKLENVALFFTENKVVLVMDKQEKKYIYDKNLTVLEEDLDPQQFFRINRQHIVNIDVIKSFRRYEKVKLEVRLNLESFSYPIIVSQQTTPYFKKWIYEA